MLHDLLKQFRERIAVKRDNGNSPGNPERISTKLAINPNGIAGAPPTAPGPEPETASDEAVKESAMKKFGKIRSLLKPSKPTT